jgi:hypothetical protein
MGEFRVGQVNLGGGRRATDDLLEEVRSRNLDVVLIQEPYVTKSGAIPDLDVAPLD